MAGSPNISSISPCLLERYVRRVTYSGPLRLRRCLQKAQSTLGGFRRRACVQNHGVNPSFLRKWRARECRHVTHRRAARFQRACGKCAARRDVQTRTGWRNWKGKRFRPWRLPVARLRSTLPGSACKRRCLKMIIALWKAQLQCLTVRERQSARLAGNEATGCLDIRLWRD